MDSSRPKNPYQDVTDAYYHAASNEVYAIYNENNDKIVSLIMPDGTIIFLGKLTSRDLERARC